VLVVDHEVVKTCEVTELARDCDELELCSEDELDVPPGEVV
jgi:hypothetical protein